MLRFSGYTVLLLLLSSHQGTAVLTKNGNGCEDSTISNTDDRNGELWVRDKYDHDCDWSVHWPHSMKVNAIIMHAFDIWINCNAGYLNFKDQNGFQCGLCEEVDEPSHFCQIYVEENVCTEGEIWKAVASHYPFCTRSVIHTGASNLTVHLVTMGAQWREFTMEYTLYECQGPRKPNVQVLGSGPPRTDRHNTENALEYNCPIIVKPNKTTTAQPAMRNTAHHNATTPSIVMKQESTTIVAHNMGNSVSYKPTASHAHPTSQSSNVNSKETFGNLTTGKHEGKTMTAMSSRVHKETSSTKRMTTEDPSTTKQAKGIQQTSANKGASSNISPTRSTQGFSHSNENDNTRPTTAVYDDTATALYDDTATALYDGTKTLVYNATMASLHDATINMEDQDIVGSKRRGGTDSRTVPVGSSEGLHICWIIIIILAVLLLISLLVIICLLVKRRKHTKKYHPSKIV